MPHSKALCVLRASATAAFFHLVFHVVPSIYSLRLRRFYLHMQGFFSPLALHSEIQVLSLSQYKFSFLQTCLQKVACESLSPSLYRHQRFPGPEQELVLAVLLTVWLTALVKTNCSHLL